ncbi:TorD/DmsD family molecular chaperone [Neobacillus drentensis]|uniref:TorD/DmsD family molecular chaperone n=1 Tax=Neobacillus drentensis TaxID=220684 RepID=UPI000B0ECF60|nr:molecular chaperone TorD family protein [Neobacillus drentensis]
MNQQQLSEITEIQNLFDLRIFAYDILRRSFLEEPTKELIAQFENGVLNFFPFKEENSQLKDGIELVNHYFKSFDMDKNFEELHWDFTRMFIGPYELPVHIWESSYVNKDRLLFQEETLLVRRLYLENCFEPLHYGREADDHLGLELDYMYHLSNIANDFAKEGNTIKLNKILADQDYFLQEHLLKWTPFFGKEVIHHSETDFYKGMVKILNGFLTIDKACIKEVLSRTN